MSEQEARALTREMMAETLLQVFNVNFKGDEEFELHRSNNFDALIDPEQIEAEHLSAMAESQLQITQSSRPSGEQTSNVNINMMRGREKSKLDDFFKVKESSIKPEQRATQLR
jgi:hypothetical protein